MKTIGVLKESNGVSVVTLTPFNVEKLKQLYSIIIEEDAGVLAGFNDREYEQSGAKIESQRERILEDADIVLTHSARVDLTNNKKKTVVVGSYNVLDDYSSILQFRHPLIDFYTLTLLPRTTKAQSMDVLSSMAAMSGYQAVMTGFNKLSAIAPMLSSAGGTLPPSKVLVLGAGVAGLQAIATAKRLGAIVYAFDVRKQTKTEVESLGAKFIEISGAKEDTESGGYAIEQDEDFTRKVQASIATYSNEMDLIIATARIPGKAAPKLITKAMVREMKLGSVIVDLAADTGGNCAETVNKGEHQLDNVLIIGDAQIFNAVARSTSILLGNNYATFVQNLQAHESTQTKDAILEATQITENGQLVHEQLLAEINSY
ncbi:MAG: NAD(P) transhydrogenase subunit alpha [Flavobacteriales bacterium]|nr:NAD(P) transhydrogenase subunit alpha [Flavobacteriales bacterium]